MNVKVIIGIQARTNSKRLPKKIYQTIGNKSILQWVYDSCCVAAIELKKRDIDAVPTILGTESDIELLKYCRENKLEAFLSSIDENDLISRYLFAAKQQKATHIIRVTADCWMINPNIVASAGIHLKECDYTSNTITRTFYEGTDVQGCSMEALKWFDKHQKSREHPFSELDLNESVRQKFCQKFKIIEIIDFTNPVLIHTSIDTREDLERARAAHDKTKNTGLILAR
jgi:spore coat polysaccharide biosynthesis protein SpsF